MYKQFILMIGIFVFIACGSSEEDIDRREKALDRRVAEIKALLERIEQVKVQGQIAEQKLVETRSQIRAIEEGLKKNSFGDGVWEVGIDIQTGRYKAKDIAGGPTGCYWAKLKENEAVIDNDNVSGPTSVTIKKNVFKFKSQGCGTWIKTN